MIKSTNIRGIMLDPIIEQLRQFVDASKETLGSMANLLIDLVIHDPGLSTNTAGEINNIFEQMLIGNKCLACLHNEVCSHKKALYNFNRSEGLHVEGITALITQCDKRKIK